MKNQAANVKQLACIGEEIGLKLGSQFIKSYQSSNPEDVSFYVIGRNVIDSILAQPGCVGLRFYNAYNELGQKTIVYVGLNEQGNMILEYNCVTNEGILKNETGIVADRAERAEEIGSLDESNWSWIID